MRVSEASLTKLSYKFFHLFSYIPGVAWWEKNNKSSVPVWAQIMLKYDHSFKTVVYFVLFLFYILYCYMFLLYWYIFFASHFWNNLHKFSMVKASLVVQLVKNPPAMQEIWVWSLGWEDPLDKGTATHSSIQHG